MKIQSSADDEISFRLPLARHGLIGPQVRKCRLGFYREPVSSSGNGELPGTASRTGGADAEFFRNGLLGIVAEVAEARRISSSTVGSERLENSLLDLVLQLLTMIQFASPLAEAFGLLPRNALINNNRASSRMIGKSEAIQKRALGIIDLTRSEHETTTALLQLQHSEINAFEAF